MNKFFSQCSKSALRYSEYFEKGFFLTGLIFFPEIFEFLLLSLNSLGNDSAWKMKNEDVRSG